MHRTFARTAAAALALVLLAGASPVRAQTIAVGFAFDAETVPPIAGFDETTTGPIEVVPTPTGRAVFVGVGPAFGDGESAVVRIDQVVTANGDWLNDDVTVLATGFSSLGGADFDPAGYNAATGQGGVLYWVDNGREANSANIGDTVFGLAGPVLRGTSVSGADLEVAPMGSIPAASDVAVAPLPIRAPGVGTFPAGTLVVSNSAGSAADESLYFVNPATGAVTEAGFAVDGYAGGLEFDGFANLYFAWADAAAPFGAHQRVFTSGTIAFDSPVYSHDGGGSSAIAIGDTDLDGVGEMILGGGFTADFSECTIPAIDPVRDTELTLFEGVPSRDNPFGCFTGGVAYDPYSRDVLFTDGVGVVDQVFELDGFVSVRRRSSSGNRFGFFDFGCAQGGPGAGPATAALLLAPAALLLRRRRAAGQARWDFS